LAQEKIKIGFPAALVVSSKEWISYSPAKGRAPFVQPSHVCKPSLKLWNPALRGFPGFRPICLVCCL